MHNNSMKKIRVFLYLFAFTILSLFVVSYYVGGDRLVYRDGYDVISENSFLDAAQFYFLYFSSPDFIWFIFAFIFSSISLSFDFFTLFLSLLVFVGFLKVSDKYIESKFLYCLFILSLFINIQFLTLYFSSERLGFAIFFLCLAMLANKNFKMGLYSIFSILSHFSVVLLLFIPALERMFKEAYHIKRRSSYVIFTIIIASLIFLFWDLISVKIVHYSSTSTSGLSKNFLKYSLVPFLVYFVNRDRFTFFINILICCILIVFDEERFFQLGYLYASWAIFTNNSLRAAFVAVAFNFVPSIRGVEFLIGVFTRGNGLDPENFGWFNL